MSQWKQREFALLLPFCSTQTLNGIIDDDHLLRWGWRLLSLLIQMLIPDTPLSAHPKIIRYQLSGHPPAQSKWHRSLTIPRSQANLEALSPWSIWAGPPELPRVSRAFIDKIRTRTEFWKGHHLEKWPFSRNRPIYRMSWIHSLAPIFRSVLSLGQA